MNQRPKDLQEQRQLAQQYAITKKPLIYGIEFTYILDGKATKGKTAFGLKTIQDLLNKLNKQEQNYLAFDSQEETNILGHNLLLKDVKYFYVKNVKMDDMAYIHVFGKQNIATYYVNKRETTVIEVIMNYIGKLDKIDTKNEKFGIGSRLEPGMQINDNILKKPIIEYVQDDEGLIRLLSY